MPSSNRLLGARQKSLVFGASALPVIIILALPLVAGWGDVVPKVYEPRQEVGSEAAEIVADLSSDLNAMAIATIAAAAVLLREWRSRAVPAKLWATVTLIVSAAIASCYAGVRFRFAVAQQIVDIPLELNLIADRLTTQGVLLLGAVAGLVYLALLTLVGPSSQSKEGFAANPPPDQLPPDEESAK